MPAQTRQSMISLSACDRRSKLREVSELLLNAVNATLSVPKKFCIVWTIAPLTQPCPEGWSGNGGVPISGVQFESGAVARLPSAAASRMAVIGRQKFQ